MGYVLTRPMRRVERDERGRVTSRVRYKKGDSPEGLDDADVQRLVNAGALVEEDEQAEQDSGATSPDVVVTAAAQSGLTADPGLRDDAPHSAAPAGHLEGTQAAETGDVSDVEGPAEVTTLDQSDEGGPDDEGNATADEEPDDEYTDMEYSDLQEAAKEKGIQANQSKAALKEALRNQ